MNFESIDKMLCETYTRQEYGSMTYFLNNEKVVATKQNECLVMYFRCQPKSHDVILTQRGIVAVGIVRNFQLVDITERLCMIRNADIVCVKGLSGRENSFERRSKRELNLSINWSIRNKPRTVDFCFELGSLGEVEEKGFFKFDDLEIVLEVKAEMCEFGEDNLYYSILNLQSPIFIRPIQECNNEVDEILKKETNWHGVTVFYTEESSGTRRVIEKTKISNYHKLAKATLTMLQN